MRRVAKKIGPTPKARASFGLIYIKTQKMNTFKNDSDRETQSLLNEEVIIDAKKKQKSTLFNTRNVLLVGGLVATGGMVGLSGNAKSAASSHKLGQDRPTIRLSVGCTPQDVLSLLPFEPKSWRGALLIVSVFVVVVVVVVVAFFCNRLRAREPSDLAPGKGEISSGLFCPSLSFFFSLLFTNKNLLTLSFLFSLLSSLFSLSRARENVI